jgi:hypothetical protein
MKRIVDTNLAFVLQRFGRKRIFLIVKILSTSFCLVTCIFTFFLLEVVDNVVQRG